MPEQVCAFAELSCLKRTADQSQITLEMSNAERLLSYSLLSLITSKPLASTRAVVEVDEDEDVSKKQLAKKGLMNEDGAWCWREDCSGQYDFLTIVRHP